MLEERYVALLRRIVAGLRDTPLDWAITGSTGLALQGVPVQPADVDLQTDAAGAYQIARCFAESVVRPVQLSASARVRSHFGALLIDAIEVEIMGAVQKRLPDGTWGPPVDVRHHRRLVEASGLWLPVLSLDYECGAYRQLGRHDRADLLARWLADAPTSSSPTSTAPHQSG